MTNDELTLEDAITHVECGMCINDLMGFDAEMRGVVSASIEMVLKAARHAIACRKAGITDDALKGADTRWKSETFSGNDILFKHKPGPPEYKSKYILPVLVIPLQEKSE